MRISDTLYHRLIPVSWVIWCSTLVRTSTGICRKGFRSVLVGFWRATQSKQIDLMSWMGGQGSRHLQSSIIGPFRHLCDI
ncbi:hypothetical protein BKA67DRAFT_544096 [Truncatella angustata]|uniref:Uncharacterized protein n=1 Tax=Truncatella angustata TaxID=152316 RepID=A0A9P8UWL5_9PEZI|nr:uncharacterized protein BKA67DRAFT_544096 [Truncatella angustata]KAH6659309.1 hypothetical protein BKA67DRAFT_544096 [Truncatella angustata]